MITQNCSWLAFDRRDDFDLSISSDVTNAGGAEDSETSDPESSFFILVYDSFQIKN